MGFNLAVLAYADHLDRHAPLDCSGSAADEDGGHAIVRALFPRTPYASRGEVDLISGGFPERGVLNVGSVAGGWLVATQDAHLYNPTKLHRRYLKPAAGRTLLLLTQRSSNDMFAFARWDDGRLTRSISVNPVGGVWEDVGDPEPFEASFWAGERPAGDGYPLPFHPLDLSDAALRAVLGLMFEGDQDPALVAPEDVRLTRWERAT